MQGLRRGKLLAVIVRHILPLCAHLSELGDKSPLGSGRTNRTWRCLKGTENFSFTGSAARAEVLAVTASSLMMEAVSTEHQAAPEGSTFGLLACQKLRSYRFSPHAIPT